MIEMREDYCTLDIPQQNIQQFSEPNFCDNCGSEVEFIATNGFLICPQCGIEHGMDFVAQQPRIYPNQILHEKKYSKMCDFDSTTKINVNNVLNRRNYENYDPNKRFNTVAQNILKKLEVPSDIVNLVMHDFNKIKRAFAMKKKNKKNEFNKMPLLFALCWKYTKQYIKRTKNDEKINNRYILTKMNIFLNVIRDQKHYFSVAMLNNAIKEFKIKLIDETNCKQGEESKTEIKLQTHQKTIENELSLMWGTYLDKLREKEDVISELIKQGECEILVKCNNLVKKIGINVILNSKPVETVATSLFYAMSHFDSVLFNLKQTDIIEIASITGVTLRSDYLRFMAMYIISEVGEQFQFTSPQKNNMYQKFKQLNKQNAVKIGNKKEDKITYILAICYSQVQDSMNAESFYRTCEHTLKYYLSGFYAFKDFLRILKNN
jgi:hypothetical protein